MDFCYPGACAACRTFCDGQTPLCSACMQQFDALAGAPFCRLCGLPVSYPEAPCPNCQGAGIAHFERVLRLGNFDEPLRGLIHQLKYHRRWDVGEYLADRLLESEAIKGLLSETDCLVAVPLHPLRRVSRGYNQAEVIVRRLAKWRGVSLVRPLVRCRHTETQTHLHTRAHRLANLKDAFRLKRPRDIEGRHVVIVDDVMTTGATLQTIARALKPAKPASLCAIVVAVADPKGRHFTRV